MLTNRRILLKENNNYILNTYNYSYKGSYYNVTLEPGIYQLECWGAQGGTGESAGGKGGYSVGTLTLSTATTIYVYVGGQGEGSRSAGTFSGGFNGGGDAKRVTGYVDSAGGCAGGGASDIRIGTDSLYARVIVAGGGGGFGQYNRSGYVRNYQGGYGGGATGGTGGQYSTSYMAGTGGSQTSPGLSYTTKYAETSSAAFGIGGSKEGNCCGGGGGWYGGGHSVHGSAGGGSGFVWTGSNAPSGYLLDSAYYLSNAQTKAGNTSFPAPSGGNETGHAGNGYVRITKLSSLEPTEPTSYIKTPVLLTGGSASMTTVPYGESTSQNLYAATFTPTEDLTNAFQYLNWDPGDYDKIVIKFSEPVANGWNIHGYGLQQNYFSLEGLTEYEIELTGDPIDDYTIFNWFGCRTPITVTECYLLKEES